MRRRLLPALAVALLPLTAQVSKAQQPRAFDRPAAPLAFWLALGDPALHGLVAAALENNPDVHAADARARSARAVRVDAALDLMPAITATSGYSRQRLPSAGVPGVSGALPEYGLWDAGIQMSWEVDVFGRGRQTLAGRSELVASAEEDVGTTLVRLAAEVAGAYFEWRGAEDRLAVARLNAENQRRSLELTRERLEGGRGTGLDTERAQAQLSTTLAAIPALEAEIMEIRYRLEALTGRTLDDVAAGGGGQSVAGTDLTRLPSAPALPAATELIRARPDVRSAERQLAARTAFVRAARADYLPRISFDGRAGYTATALDAMGSAGTPRYAFGPVLSWPLLDLGRVGARVDAARAERSEAAARYEQAVLRARAQLSSTLVAYDKARERLRHLEEAAAASERATELARLRFEEGATGFIDVLDAERTQLEAQDRLALGRAQATAGLVAVYRALGGRWAIGGGEIE